MLVAENVKALRKLLPVLEAEYGKAGYKCHAQLFNSKYWGVPQNRERYIVVGTLDSLPDTYTYPEEQHDYVPKLSTILEADVDDKFYIADEKAHKIIDQALQRMIGMLESSGHDHSRRVHDPEGISPTATAVAGGTHHIKIFDHTKYRVRKLTPTEYGRLQAFPMDNWKQVVSNSQAYKQFGNAVTVTLAEGIGKSVIGYLDSVLGGATV